MWRCWGCVKKGERRRRLGMAAGKRASRSGSRSPSRRPRTVERGRSPGRPRRRRVGSPRIKRERRSKTRVENSEKGKETDVPKRSFIFQGRKRHCIAGISIGVVSLLLFSYQLGIGWDTPGSGSCAQCVNHEYQLEDLGPGEEVPEEGEGPRDPLPVCATLYHEKQRLQLGLLHAMNNLLQDPAFTRKELDSIAESIRHDESTPFLRKIFGSHHNKFLGWYDEQVLVRAMEGKGMVVVQMDPRNGLAGLNLRVYGPRLLGLIVDNGSGHWVAFRKFLGDWFDLDSKNHSPVKFCAGERDLRRYLERVFDNGGEIMLILYSKITSP